MVCLWREISHRLLLGHRDKPWSKRALSLKKSVFDPEHHIYTLRVKLTKINIKNPTAAWPKSMGKHPWNEWRGSQQRNGSYKKTTKRLKRRERDFPGEQWLRICLGCRAHGLDPWSGEDSMCCRVTKAVCVPRLLSPCAESLCSATGEATTMRSPRTPTRSGPCLPRLEDAHVLQWRLSAAKIN